MTATNELDGKFLTHLKFQILQEKRMELINNINPDRHIDYLRSRFLFSEEDSQEIQCLTTRRKKAGLFLDILLRNPKGFDNLCESLLIEKTQIFLLEMLNKEFEKRLKIYKDLMQEPNGNTDIDVPINVDKRALPRPSSNRHNDSDSKDKLKCSHYQL